jgi:heme/copper-type cytochrome/quinol oxidase subunit 2
MRVKISLLAVFALLGTARGAFAQGCVLCYTTGSAAGPAAQRSLDLGILTLLAPALTLFLAVMFLLYRRAVSAAA